MVVYGAYDDSHEAANKLKELAELGLAGWIMEVKG